MESSKSSSGGTSILTLLQVLFIGLKLGEVGVVAKWSWWWVMAPSWFGLVVVALVLLAWLAVHGKEYFALKRQIREMEANPPVMRKSKFQERLDRSLAEAEAERKRATRI